MSEFSDKDIHRMLVKERVTVYTDYSGLLQAIPPLPGIDIVTLTAIRNRAEQALKKYKLIDEKLDNDIDINDAFN